VPGEAYIILGSEAPLPVQFLADITVTEVDVPFRFTGEYWEPNGWVDISFAELILVDDAGAGLGFKVGYDSIKNGLYLFDHRTEGWLGPCLPQENGRLVNEVVQLECLGSRIITDENHTLRVMWRIRWIQNVDLKEEFTVNLRVVDKSGNDSRQVSFGTWIPGGKKMFLPIIK
jgi:hypothetical protein